MITVTADIPTFDTRAQKAIFENAFVNAAKEMGNNIEQDYQTTVRTWDHKVVFKQKTLSTGDYTIQKVWTDDDIYRYVHDGTDVRYAVLSPDFIPKTLPYYLGSFPGRGGVVRYDSKNPRPGIIARNFTDTIAKKQEPRLEKVVDSHLRRAVSQSGFQHS